MNHAIGWLLNSFQCTDVCRCVISIQIVQRHRDDSIKLPNKVFVSLGRAAPLDATLHYVLYSIIPAEQNNSRSQSLLSVNQLPVESYCLR